MVHDTVFPLHFCLSVPHFLNGCISSFYFRLSNLGGRKVEEEDGNPVTSCSACSALWPDFASIHLHKGSSHKRWVVVAHVASPCVCWRENKICWPAPLGSTTWMMNEMMKKSNGLVLTGELRLSSCTFDFPNLLGHRLVSLPKYLYILYTTNHFLALRKHFPGCDLGGDPVSYLFIQGSNLVMQ